MWQSIPPQDRENLGQKSRADGEFWISYEDWISNFESIQMMNILKIKSVKFLGKN